MRIWILTTEMPPEFKGGIARYIDNFAPRVGAAGHEVVIITRSDHQRDEMIAPNVRLITVVPLNSAPPAGPNIEPDQHPNYPHNVVSYWPAVSFQMADRVLELLEELPHPDVIECQEYAGLAYYLLQRKLVQRGPLEKIPVVVHLHSPLYELMRVNEEPRYRFPEYWIGQMEKSSIRMADAILSPSRFLAEQMKQNLDPTLEITSIPLPVGQHTDTASAEVQPGELVFFGRLELRKGVLPLIAACERLWDTGADFRLSMIGGDTRFEPKHTTVRAFIEKKHRRWIDEGRLNLTGPMEYTELLQVVRQAWAVMIPSLWENFPNVCIEAMMLGQVVLASRSGGQGEMVAEDGEFGFLFDWQNPGELEAQIKRVLTLDLETRSAISKRAQERIRSICAPEIVVSQRIEHFQKVIDNHAPRKLFPTAVTANAESLAESERLSSEVVAQHGLASETPRLLSIVVPCYNLGHFLPEVLENLEQTTYRPYEVVIVDDGSSDPESLRIFDNVEAESGEHVRIVHTLNQGLPATRNTGADHAKGEFVFFLDADDLVEPEFFAKAIDVLDRYENVDFVYPWVRYFEGSQGIWPTWNAEFPYLLGHNMASGGFSVFRRQAFMLHGRNKSEIAYSLEDFEMFVHLVGAGCVGVSLPDPLVRYRVRSDSMWQTSNANMHQLLYDQISSFHKPLYQQWGVELFNLQNANGPGRLWNHPGIEMRQDTVTIPHAENGEMQRAIKRLESQINQYQYDLATMKAWADELERAKRWLAEQSERRQGEIERREQMIEDLQPRADRAEAELAEVRRIVNNPADLQDWQRRIENMDRIKRWMPSPMRGLLRRVLKWR